jgi:hypothetical protein
MAEKIECKMIRLATEKIKMEEEKIINGNCWFAYFDILGFKNKTREYKDHLDVFRNLYDKILKEVEKVPGYKPDTVFIHWFSDSFIFYCSNDSMPSYVVINLGIRRFFQLVLWEKWPLRGALTVGELYVDNTKNIFLGQAIIDAYEYAEKQDWIGLVITPMARSRVEGFHITKINDVYADYDIPIKSENGETEKLLAFRFAHFPSTTGRFDRTLKKMLEKEPKEQQNYSKIKRKYDNTLKFIEDTKPKDANKRFSVSSVAKDL